MVEWQWYILWQNFFQHKIKGIFCKENNIDFTIEDDPKNLKTLIRNTNVIVFDYPYNIYNFKESIKWIINNSISQQKIYVLSILHSLSGVI